MVKILFGREPVRNATIRCKIDASRFEAGYLPFDPPPDWERYNAIVPLTLPDLWHLHRHCQALNGVRFIAPDWPMVELTHDKPRFNQRLHELGFGALVPRTGTGLPWPYVLKRNRDAGGEHSHLIRGPEDEQVWATELASPGYFCQEYVEGQSEYTTHFLFDCGIHHQVSIQFDSSQPLYLRGVQTQASGGISMQVVAMPCEDVFSPILARIGFRGTCCFNYKLSRGRPLIFELNPRFGGSLPVDLNLYLEATLKLLQPATRRFRPSFAVPAAAPSARPVRPLGR